MIIGIDLGGTSISLGQLKNGQLVKKVTAPSPSDKGLEESLEIIKNTIAPLVTPELKGIGIGVPSVVDIKRGIVYNVANMPSWKEVHLKEVLENEFKIPVFINNDANCFAIGENRFGEGKLYENMVAVTLGTGIGAGIVINNELYSGNNTGAGEIGEIKYLNSIYEDYCASNFFSAYHNTTGRIAAEKAEKKDAEALKTWAEYGQHMGNMLQTILLAYDPDAVIFGGSIANAYSHFKESMMKSMETFPYPKSLEKLEIRISKNPDIAILGAAALVKL